MAQNRPSKLDTEYLYSKLKYRHQLSEKRLKEKHPNAVSFLESHGIKPEKIRQQAMKIVTSGALAGSLLLASPSIGSISELVNKPKVLQSEELQQTLSGRLTTILPKVIKPLSPEQEENLSRLFFQVLGINSFSKLGSTKLNNSYGLIGAEQHLPRFPGDTIALHDEYQKSGITPGLGAWGYFARSKKDLTQDLIEKEKYYVAVQTLYLPDWNQRTKFLANWYKYRKVVVVNPVNGRAIIAVVADAGPAKWTGKHFGGSPEVMAYLKLNVGKQKGPVVLYFVDDPDNKVPLGPLEYNINQVELIAKK